MQQKKFTLEPDLKFMTVRVPDQLDVDFTCLCKQKRKTKSSVLIELMKDYLRTCNAQT